MSPTLRSIPRRSALVALAAGMAHLPLVRAQQPVRLIVPYAPGGPIDVTARLLAEQVKDTLGTVIIDNRPGAGGNIGADAVAKAAPDGLTIGIAATATHAVNPWLYAKMPFDAARDFAGITQMLRVPNVLVMRTERAQELGIKSVADLIAYAKAHPGQLNYGSGGNGSAGHLAGELLKQKADIDATHVPYKGASPAQLALLSGEVDFNIDNLASAAANVEAGKLVALAVTSQQGTSLLPRPTLAATFPGFVVDTWWGLVAPKGTPREVLLRLHGAFAEALKSNPVRFGFAKLRAEPSPSDSPTAFDRFMQRERERYRDIVKLSGARVD